jgi:hypothetical protein
MPILRAARRPTAAASRAARPSAAAIFGRSPPPGVGSDEGFAALSTRGPATTSGSRTGREACSWSEAGVEAADGGRERGLSTLATPRECAGRARGSAPPRARAPSADPSVICLVGPARSSLPAERAVAAVTGACVARALPIDGCPDAMAGEAAAVGAAAGRGAVPIDRSTARDASSAGPDAGPRGTGCGGVSTRVSGWPGRTAGASASALRISIPACEAGSASPGASTGDGAVVSASAEAAVGGGDVAAAAGA